MKRLAQRIKDHGAAIGTIVTVASPALAEALSWSGLDWLFFDLEHSTMTISDVQSMIQAMNKDCMSFIRLEEPEAVYVKRALDTKCDGIIVPQVNSVEIAKRVIAAGRYPPAGTRSIGLGRALGYGYGSKLADGVKTENDRVSIILQIEHIDAVKEIDRIGGLDGIDGVFIGPNDLSGSMGIPGQVNDPAVQEQINLVVNALKPHNRVLGIFSKTEEVALKAQERGFNFIAVGADLMRLSDSCQATMSQLRQSAR